MSVLPRTLLISALVLVAFSPLASAGTPETCVEMILANYASGLRVIANTGESIALGFMSGYPGDGVGYVAVITPSLCPGIDTGSVSSGLGEIGGVLEDLPALLPLP